MASLPSDLPSRRLIRRPARYTAAVHQPSDHLASPPDSLDAPASYTEALTRPNAQMWQQAMDDEIQAMLQTSTFEPADLPPDRHPVTCKWLYKIKRNAAGGIARFKARLVARGFSQVRGLDYDETYAPVAKYTSLRILLSLAATHDYEIHQMDVQTAFLNGDLAEEVYLTPPPG